MDKFEKYEEICGQLINKNKYGFYVPFKDDDPRINSIRDILDFNQSQFPMQYLGCPIYFGRKRIVYFNNMVAKVSKRLQRWQGKLLSYGEKVVLIKSVLHALPIHLLLFVHPLKTTLEQI